MKLSPQMKNFRLTLPFYLKIRRSYKYFGKILSLWRGNKIELCQICCSLYFHKFSFHCPNVFQCRFIVPSCSTSWILTRWYSTFCGGFYQFGLCRSSAFACDLCWFRQYSTLWAGEQSSRIQHFNSTCIWLIKCSLIYLLFFLNAWAWQRGDSWGIECQVLHCVSAVSFHMLFRDSWRQTSQGYEVKELYFFFPRT